MRNALHIANELFKKQQDVAWGYDEVVMIRPLRVKTQRPFFVPNSDLCMYSTALPMKIKN
jgi:hypothetical protein